MLFNSVQFLLFFPLVCLVYFPLPQVLKKPWLLVCSYYFYMCWDARFALLIFVSTLSTWLCGFLLERARAPRVRRLALWANIGLNLGILFVFKYFDFFTGTISALFGALGLAWRLPALGLTLPVGISFYTFQALGYSIDVYRGELPHEHSLLHYALFVSFFPQLVAGPIERAKSFLPQLRRPIRFDERRTEEGLLRMLLGFFKKVVIADGLAAFVDVVYAAPEKFSAAALITATVLFALQIYCDFAGYSDIAVGAAWVLGYRLMRNFDRPYFSTSIAEFWSRWHISLSGWLQDYIFTPLAWDLKKHSWAPYFAVLVTFLASGLWHGANWTFVVWGALHAVYRMIGMLTKKGRKRLYKKLRVHTDGWLFRSGQMLWVFVWVCASYVFFRAQTLGQAGLILQRVFAGAGGSVFDAASWKAVAQELAVWGTLVPSLKGLLANTGAGLVGCLALLTVLDTLDTPQNDLCARLSCDWFPVRWAVALLLLLCILLYGSFAPSGFYYFQF